MTLKRLITLAYLAFSALVGCGAPVLAAGTTPFALVPQTDQGGSIAAGCKLYFYQSGTVATPQDSYVDYGLTTKNPWPLTCDQGGRVPMHWLADGLVHLTLLDSFGGMLADTTMYALGPSSGGGGGGSSVDPTSLFQTGTIMSFYGSGARSGYVRANGLTIGNGTSGATERANNDVQGLFLYLYGADGSLTVSGGRSGNALADFNAGKQLTLPDMRGRVIAGDDSMGNGDAGRLAGGALAPGRFTLGYAGGESGHTLTVAEMPSHNHSIIDPGHTHNTTATQVGVGGSPSLISGGTGSPFGNFNFNVGSSLTGITVQNNGGGSSHNLMQPTMLATLYLKL